jgi:hypothetical protein
MDSGEVSAVSLKAVGRKKSNYLGQPMKIKTNIQDKETKPKTLKGLFQNSRDTAAQLVS